MSKEGGRLTTHVLDTMHGRPAAGVRIELFHLEADKANHVAFVKTNADGRCDAPLMAGEGFVPGVYELRFDVGNYFAELDVAVESQFLGIVPVRFTISEADGHYHVPLLVTPYSYSTYRGS